ncbi:sensor histidine kinase [Pedobacter insulae]|uniref:histidine kinase n=1 Tax=Pedobacter insulae TaxID=414048 RepID=A0A1I2VQ73_9SPHI|nr:histidine kinase N-terminal 7TM domain-containing protein [Pedobacter insulae]SFG91464.1 Signal transduction histidine kinase [Pedobacter insulae]
MTFTFNIYAILLILFGSVTIALAFFIYRKGGNAVRWFSLMMFSNAIWSIAYGFELASADISQIKILLDIEYIGIATVPLNWFLFCLHFSGKECWYKKPLNIVSLLFIPVVTVLMVWTNSYHHLHYASAKMATGTPFPMIDLTPGIWYQIFTIYFYLIMACGCFLLAIKFRKSDPIFRKQNYSLIVAAAIPWIANIAYLLGIRPLGYVDVTPFAFVITSFLILLGIYKFKLFDIIPLAREKVLELMQDGFFVLDKDYRIIDYNQSIKRYINYTPNLKLIGSSLEQLLPDQPNFLEMLNRHAPGKIELDVPVDGEILSLEADIIFLDDNKINNDFIIIKLQDLTAYKKEAIRSKEQSNELERLNQLKDRIFSIIAHDLRGPLVNLSEVLKMIANNQISNDEFRNISPTLSKDIIYTTDLLENILHWSRSQLKGYGVNKEVFNIRNLIINEINYHLPAAELKKIKIIHDVFPGEMAYADILMIQIVVRNLLNNAIKFCNPGNEIHITANYQKNKTMLVCIEDNGMGIKKEVLGRLFKDENITTRGTLNEKGTGLGLIVCRDFMIRNDGNITVTSVEGKGAKFCLILPVGELN